MEKQREIIKDSTLEALSKKKTQEDVIRKSMDDGIKKDASHKLLMLCSCLAPDTSKDLLQKLATNTEFDDKTLDDALKELSTYSLISNKKVNNVVGDGQELFMHRFIQGVARDKYKNQLTPNWYGEILNKLHAIKKDGTKGEHDYYKKRYLLPHLEAIFDNKKNTIALEKYSADMIRGYIDMALLYKAIGAAERALTHYENIKPWIEQNRNAPSHRNLLVDFYLGQGRAYQGGPGDYKEAKYSYEQAYELHKNIKIKGEDDFEYNAKSAEILNDLGMACRDLGDKLREPGRQDGQECLALFDKALEHLNGAVNTITGLKDREMERVRYQSNLGEVYRQLARFDKAEKEIKEAVGFDTNRAKHLVIVDAIKLGKNQEERKTIEAAIKIKIGKNQEEREIIETAIKIGKNPQERMVIEKAIKIGQNQEEYKVIESAVKIGKRPEECKIIIEAIKAGSRQEESKIIEAIQIGRSLAERKVIKDAIGINKGQEERVLAGAYFNLGQVYLSKGDKIISKNAIVEAGTQAKEFYLKARENFIIAAYISGEIYDDKHPLVARHVDALGMSYKRLGDETAACAKFNEAFSILTFSKGVQKPLREKILQHVESCQKNNNNKPKM